jgi:hypothetical protein
MEKATIALFKKLNIDVSGNSLDNTIMERDIFLSASVYKEVEAEINSFRTIMGSSYFTSMQKTAEYKQKWPLLNLVRQILKKQNYTMNPIRKADGYKNGVKMYKRFFSIHKYIKQVT